MKVAFYTLGCKVNQYESNSVACMLKAAGYDIVHHSDSGIDIVVVNSCTVTAESDRKTRQTVRRFKKTHPNAVIVLMGCMAQAIKEKGEKLVEADIVTGNADHANIPNLINEYFKNRKRIVSITPHEKGEKYDTPSISDFSDRTRAYIKIEDGCDRFCSYCIIPFARGRVRSRDLNDIKKEALELKQKGFSELVLTGINLSAYGKDNGLTLADAVRAVADCGIKRVRLGSLEPDHMTDELLLALRSVKEFCPQFHLSLQSGCDATLKRMNRHYDTAFYADLIDRIRKIYDNPSITTDVMVGFAGESGEEFSQSVNFVRKSRFAKAHVFAYSRREGTVAAKLPNQVNESEKEIRSREMIAAAAEGEANFLASQVGCECEVLFETSSDTYTEGYSENYTRVLIPKNEALHSKIQKVKILSSKDTYCLGEII